METKKNSLTDIKTAHSNSTPNLSATDFSTPSVASTSFAYGNNIVHINNNSQSQPASIITNSFSTPTLIPLNSASLSSPFTGNHHSHRNSSMSLSSYLTVAAAAAAHFNMSQNNDINTNITMMNSAARVRPFAYQSSMSSRHLSSATNYSIGNMLPDVSNSSIPSLSSQLSAQNVNTNAITLEQFTYAISPQYRPQSSLEQQLLQFSNSIVDSSNYLSNTLPTPPALQNPTSFQQHHTSSSSAMAAALSQLQPQYLSSLNSVLSANSLSMTSLSNTDNTANNLRNLIMDRLQDFVLAEAKRIISKFGKEAISGSTANTSPQSSAKIMSALKNISQQFTVKNIDFGVKPLNELKEILLSSEISVFHFTHSGIGEALTAYLTDSTDEMLPSRKIRLQRFADNLQPPDRMFGGLLAFEKLISKVILSIGQLEQFTVKITNLSGIGSTNIASTTYLRGAQAMRFFQSHQIRLHLQRHPSCKKVDPFASVSSIERYLLERGVGRPSNHLTGEDSSDNDDASDEDQIDLNEANEQTSDVDENRHNPGLSNERIELFMGTHKLASDLTILQAIQQCSYPHDDETQETIPASMWMTAHQIFYRAAVSTPTRNVEINMCTSADTTPSTSIATDETQSSSSTPTISSEPCTSKAHTSPLANNNTVISSLRRREHKSIFWKFFFINF